VILVFSLFTGTALAAEEYILTSPPRESKAKGVEIYQPIADYLTQLTGKPFVYRYPQNWLTYQSDMQKGLYDIVFDGPGFIGWRIAKQDHVPLIKVPGNLVFVLVTKKENDKFREFKDMAGHTICAFAPPNMSTLTVQYQFDNPARQPLIVETKSFKAAYEGVLSGKCKGGILQAKMYEEFDKEKQAMKVLFKSKPIANQAFTASARIPPEMRQKITEGLLSPQGEAALAKLREEFKGQKFVPASREEYEGLGMLLRDVWGFDPDAPARTAKDTAVKNRTAAH
jgi:hypothetical protein